MPLLRGGVRATHILDDNKLASDATGVSDGRGASVRRQVVEEMAGEDPVELAVVERQRCDISLEPQGKKAEAVLARQFEQWQLNATMNSSDTS